MKKYCSLFILLCLPILAFAASKPIIEGKDYKLIASPVAQSTLKKVSVIEFFSYGCPWCSHLEPTIEQWIKKKPSYVNFKRVPVTFEPHWDVYARAYYTALALDVEDKITPAMFQAIHKDHQRLRSAGSLRKLFAKYGIDKKAFDDVFEYTPSIDLQVKQAPKIMKQYNVLSVPTLIVGGKYETDMGMARGENSRLITILNYLTKKVRREQQRHTKKA